MTITPFASRRIDPICTELGIGLHEKGLREIFSNLLSLLIAEGDMPNLSRQFETLGALCKTTLNRMDHYGAVFYPAGIPEPVSCAVILAYTGIATHAPLYLQTPEAQKGLAIALASTALPYDCRDIDDMPALTRDAVFTRQLIHCCNLEAATSRRSAPTPQDAETVHACLQPSRWPDCALTRNNRMMALRVKRALPAPKPGLS